MHPAKQPRATSNKPILIIGAGPVGLSLAMALTRRGINVEVFEADEELNREIRASTFHPPTLETFAGWGVLDTVLENGHIVDRLQYWERASRELIAEFDYGLIADDTPNPHRVQCPQHILTRLLLPVVQASEYGQVHMGHRLVSFADQGDHVQATFETPQGQQNYAGRYLCAADGSRSTVRDQLKLGFDGSTYEDRFLLMGTDIDLTPLFPEMGPVSYIFDPDEWVIILNLPDIVRVVFRMRPDEVEAEATTETAMRARIDGFVGEALDYEIKVTQVYKVHQRVADTFRVGNVLLLGDAAHINNPAGGMGMNSGIHDAIFLAERLEQVLNGGSDDLLDEYSQVRKAVAMQSIQGYTDKRYNDMAEKDETKRLQRNRELAEIAADPARAREYLLKASMLEERI